MMCGIAGFIEPSNACTPELQLHDIAREMANQLVHRGPDDLGTWVDPSCSVGLGFRRLAIVDLSPKGRQPMTSASGRFVICFNGEVYNHRELRHTMLGSGMEFRGLSDTEVLLAAIECFGVRDAFRHVVGMFAAAIWDRVQRRLYLVRDRLGEKPLYYGWAKHTLVFGSELHALRRHPNFDGAIDSAAVASLLRYGYVPTPGSIYHRVWKLPPGSMLSIDLGDGLPSDLPLPEAYWLPSGNGHIDRPSTVAESRNDSGQASVNQLERLLTEVVREQVVADVPLGAFLSGGIDSSTIVALMQAVSPARVKTYTIGFAEPRFDEAPHARKIARHLGTDHSEWYVTEQMALDLVPQLGRVYDEPFADSSQIPTLLVAQLARQHVTVCLSGDGGDEVFGGYSRYGIAQRTAQIRRWLPSTLRTMMAKWVAKHESSGVVPYYWRSKLSWAANLLTASDEAAAYACIMSAGRNPRDMLRDSRELPSIFDKPTANSKLPMLRQLMLIDLQSYLPDDILVKVDRAAMSTGLETRAPFLDHRVVEFANSLPLNCLQRRGKTKWVMRELLRRYVPKTLTDRPKMGFGVPLAQWMRGPLRDWCEGHLSEASLQNAGFFREAAVRRIWNRHLVGELDASSQLWPLLMFQEWRQVLGAVDVSGRTAA